MAEPDRGAIGDRAPSLWASLDGGVERGTTAVVGKTLEAAIVILFLGVLASTLHAGVAPTYERATGDDVADRVVVTASEEIECAVPPDRTGAGVRRFGFERERRVDLPPRIGSRSYRIEAAGEQLRLVHPDLGDNATTRLAVPSRVAAVTGTWRSGRETFVVVESDDSDGTLAVTIRLVNR
ncbi:MAG: hypothetical protein V5A46_04780 [Haloferacaceae archaeon]